MKNKDLEKFISSNIFEHERQSLIKDGLKMEDLNREKIDFCKLILSKIKEENKFYPEKTTRFYKHTIEKLLSFSNYLSEYSLLIALYEMGFSVKNRKVKFSYIAFCEALNEILKEENIYTYKVVYNHNEEIDWFNKCKEKDIYCIIINDVNQKYSTIELCEYSTNIEYNVLIEKHKKIESFVKDLSYNKKSIIIHRNIAGIIYRIENLNILKSRSVAFEIFNLFKKIKNKK